jgi:hypothetical protein
VGGTKTYDDIPFRSVPAPGTVLVYLLFVIFGFAGFDVG